MINVMSVMDFSWNYDKVLMYQSSFHKVFISRLAGNTSQTPGKFVLMRGQLMLGRS